MQSVIPGLQGTSVHELSVSLYLEHHDTGAGVCARCGEVAPCGARRHAASVIVSAGDDPRRYAALPADAARQARSRRQPGGRQLPEHEGIRVNGRRRSVDLDDAGYRYDREAG